VGNKIKGNRIHTVQMEVLRGTCTCQKSQLTDTLCSHILACCAQWGISSNRYVAHFYRVNELLVTWVLEFEPFGNSDTWPEIWRPKLVPDPIRYAVMKG
jgi:SWIM zinc finger